MYRFALAAGACVHCGAFRHTPTTHTLSTTPLRPDTVEALDWVGLEVGLEAVGLCHSVLDTAGGRRGSWLIITT